MSIPQSIKDYSEKEYSIKTLKQMEESLYDILTDFFNAKDTFTKEEWSFLEEHYDYFNSCEVRGGDIKLPDGTKLAVWLVRCYEMDSDGLDDTEIKIVLL